MSACGGWGGEVQNRRVLVEGFCERKNERKKECERVREWWRETKKKGKRMGITFRFFSWKGREREEGANTRKRQKHTPSYQWEDEREGEEGLRKTHCRRLKAWSKCLSTLESFFSFSFTTSCLFYLG